MNVAARSPLITDDEFARMVARGLGEVLGPVELREGKLHRMNAQHVPHLRAKMSVFRALDAALRCSAADLEIDIEGSVAFGDGFAPLPDIVIWRSVSTKGPIPGDSVRMIVEVSEATLADDLGAKQAAYAKARLPEYWVVDLKARVLHTFSAPEDGAYTRAATHPEGTRVESAAVPGAAILFQLPA